MCIHYAINESTMPIGSDRRYVQVDFNQTATLQIYFPKHYTCLFVLQAVTLHSKIRIKKILAVTLLRVDPFPCPFTLFIQRRSFCRNALLHCHSYTHSHMETVQYNTGLSGGHRAAPFEL